jgi:hypothetical protein
MGRVKKEKAAITAEFLFRYMVARYRCVGGSVSSGRIRLASEIRGGLQVFEGAIIVDADVQPPIINDHEHQDFFIAIFKGGSAIPKIEPEEFAGWRNYVLHGGPVPQWRQPAGTRDSTLAPDGKRENDLMSWVSNAGGQVRQRWRALFSHGSRAT